jgi:hypothetical protein
MKLLKVPGERIPPRFIEGASIESINNLIFSVSKTTSLSGCPKTVIPVPNIVENGQYLSRNLLS